MRYIIPLLASILVVGVWTFAVQSSADSIPAPAPVAADAPQPTAPAPTRDALLKPLADDFQMGNTDAKAVIIEYSSLSCPHCAEFHNKIFPKVKEEYIDTGKALFIHRDFPLNGPALKGAMLAQCSPEQYFTFLKVLFSTQSKWAFSPDSMKVLEMTAKLGGISKEKFDACMNDKKIEQRILQTRKDAADVLKVESTPTFFVNGEPVKGGHDFEEFRTHIDKNL